MIEEKKLCKDCRWCRYIPHNNGVYSTCHNPKFLSNSCVTGIVDKQYCEYLRDKETNFLSRLKGRVFSFCIGGEHFEKRED